MTQIRLMQISQRLKKGQAIIISQEDLWEATRGEFNFGFDSVRHSDVEKFAKKIEKNWDIRMKENPMSRNWTMSKVT